MPLPILPTHEVIKETVSRCPYCHVACPAEVRKSSGSPQQVLLARRCPTHGEISTVISSDARFYWKSTGMSSCGASCACSAADDGVQAALGRNATLAGELTFERLSTCIALIEIVDSCNLRCPVCFADSPFDGRSVKAPSFDNIIERIEGVLDRKGHIEILQLSGGEPTLHPQFFELLEWIYANPRIDYVLINSNGVRLARDAAFLARFKEVVRDNTQVYLQFDGSEEAGQRALRGADLRQMREEAIGRCGEIGLPVTLAMTVTRENLPTLWRSIEFGLQFPHVRGISFQPLFTSGRVSEGVVSEERVNVADIIVSAVTDSAGTLRYEDFTPLPCGDPNCATIGYLLKIDGKVRSISEFVDFSTLQGFLSDRIRYTPEDLERCGCESEPLGHLLKQFEMDESHTFRIFIKPFMDAWSWDQDRIDRCCTHVIRPDGKLDSFCRYYSGFKEG